MKLLFIIFLLSANIIVNYCAFQRRKNACRSIEDYNTIYNNNPHCFYNPDVEASVPEIITRYGFPFEVYKLTSEDGYILGLFRIPHNGTNINEKRRPVLLHHGLDADSTAWFLLANKSLPFDLSRNGFDVWLINARGSLYSSEHVDLSIYDQKYWDFSFHEMAVFDLPTILDFITAKTGQKGEINYIGHSMGTTISYIYSSLKTRHARNHLRKIVSLAPVAFLGHVKGSAQFILPFFKTIADVFRSAGIHGIGKNFESLIKIHRKLCSQYPFMIMCVLLSGMMAGLNFDEVVPAQATVTLSAYPAGVSLKSIEHFAQISLAKMRFQFFDYGYKKNLFLYKSHIPPEYPLNRISVPIFLLYGKNDLLTAEEDIFMLYSKLKGRKNITEAFNFDHNDFVVGKHAPDIYKLIIDYFE